MTTPLVKKIEELVHPHKFKCPARSEDGSCFQLGRACPYSMKILPNCEDYAIIQLHNQYLARLKKEMK